MIGLMRAKEYVFTGERIPAARRMEWGLVNRVVPAGEVLPGAVALAHKLSRAPCPGCARHQASHEPPCHPGLVGMLDQALSCERASVNSVEHADLTRQLIEAGEARAARSSQATKEPRTPCSCRPGRA